MEGCQEERPQHLSADDNDVPSVHKSSWPPILKVPFRSIAALTEALKFVCNYVSSYGNLDIFTLQFLDCEGLAAAKCQLARATSGQRFRKEVGGISLGIFSKLYLGFPTVDRFSYTSFCAGVALTAKMLFGAKTYEGGSEKFYGKVLRPERLSPGGQ